jgi:hypothetical protein
MEMFYVILGIVSVILLLLLGYLVSGVVNLKNRIDYLESFLEDTDRRIDIENKKNKEHRLNLMELFDVKLDVNEKHILSQLDSRLDKLDNKFKTNVASGIEVKKALVEIDVIRTDFDEFVKMYRNQ